MPPSHKSSAKNPEKSVRFDFCIVEIDVCSLFPPLRAKIGRRENDVRRYDKNGISADAAAIFEFLSKKKNSKIP